MFSAWKCTPVRSLFHAKCRLFYSLEKVLCSPLSCSFYISPHWIRTFEVLVCIFVTRLPCTSRPNEQSRYAINNHCPKKADAQKHTLSWFYSKVFFCFVDDLQGADVKLGLDCIYVVGEIWNAPFSCKFELTRKHNHI